MDRRSAIFTLGGVVLAALSAQLRAETLSGRTLRFVVGYPAGGVADFIARATTEGLKGTTAATVLVENRPGAAGNIALELVAKSAGDSGVFGAFSNSQITTNSFVPQLASKNVDPFKELVPVIALVDMILVLAVSAKLRANGLEPLNLRRAETAARLADEASYMKEFLSKVKLDFAT